MSWSIQKTMGSASKVRAAVEPEFERAAKPYAGQAEEQDVLSAKTSMLSWLDACLPDEGVSVDATGSRGATWLTVAINCAKINLKI